jgi:hypothetical protein
MNPTKLGEPFSELFHQSPIVVHSASEPDMEDAPAIFIRWDANFHHKCTDLPDDARTAAIRGDYERITPITSLGAVRLRDGPETPLVSAVPHRFINLHKRMPRFTTADIVRTRTSHPRRRKRGTVNHKPNRIQVCLPAKKPEAQMIKPTIAAPKYNSVHDCIRRYVRTTLRLAGLVISHNPSCQ